MRGECKFQTVCAANGTGETGREKGAWELENLLFLASERLFLFLDFFGATQTPFLFLSLFSFHAFVWFGGFFMEALFFRSSFQYGLTAVRP